MSTWQTIFIAVAFSGPIATLAGVVRAALCFYRSARAKHLLFSIFSGVAILALLTIFAAIIVVWFGYGVAHTGKDTKTDLMVLAATVAPAYVGVFFIWRLVLYIEKRLSFDAI